MKDNIITKPLPWAAEGISVTKSCDVSCYVSNSQSLLGTADAVMMEIINHPRVFGDGAIKWPKKKPGQLWGMFFYEPYQNHQHFLTPEVVDKFDFKVTSSQDSELPITLICPWGRSFDAYLHPPPTKRTDAAICDFSPAIASQYQPFFEELHKNIEVHAYAGQLKNREPSQPYNLKTRLREVGKYKFAIVSEYVIENDYISPELSQAWLAGAVPIYLGAPNVDDFVPGENSIIKASDFASGKELADFIHSLLEDEDKYYSYLAWKDKELSPSFRRHLENCAHLAECRICHYVIEQQALAAQQ